jgi:plasmid stabilization system protein ParE
MAYKLVKTDSFQRDLDAAIGYIALSLENKIAAASLLDAIEQCYDGIERMPLMYEACHDPRLRELGYRKVVIRNYIMVYQVDKDSETVNILRFFHGRQDYEKLI